MDRGWAGGEETLGGFDSFTSHLNSSKTGAKERNVHSASVLMEPHKVETGPPQEHGCFVLESASLTLIVAALLQGGHHMHSFVHEETEAKNSRKPAAASQ